MKSIANLDPVRLGPKSEPEGPIPLQQPLELIHIGISSPVTPSVAGNSYTLEIMDEYTGKSNVFMLMTKNETYGPLECYRNRSQTEFNDQLRLQNIKSDKSNWVGENKGEYVKEFSQI